MRLTGHTSRTIFDRYNIINEQELLEAGDQLVAYLAQHAQTTPRGGRTRPAPLSRAPCRPSASCDALPRKGGRLGPSGETGLDTRQTPGRTRPAHRRGPQSAHVARSRHAAAQSRPHRHGGHRTGIGVDEDHA